jgi:pimeloyl-ACP methyl ester carboxylesterase
VITWDIRGHGRTRAPAGAEHYSAELSVGDMVAVLDACDVDEAVVAGLSLGGYLSLAFHLAHRDRVRALLLFDTGPGFKNDEARERWNTYALSRAAAFEERGLSAQSESPETAYGPHDPNGLARAARGILTQQDAGVISSLGGIAVPTLVLVGENDGPFLAAADYMASKIPSATKVVVSDAGHAANLDQPQQFNRAVEGFLQSL